MRTAASARSGRPLMALAVLLCLWTAVRASLWQSPFPVSLPDLPVRGLDLPDLIAAKSPVSTPARKVEVFAESVAEPSRSETAQNVFGGWQADGLAGSDSGYVAEADRDGPSNALLAASANHQILFAAGLSRIPSTTDLLGLLASRGEARAWIPAADLRSPATRKRWSLDGWALWRGNSASEATIAGPRPSYGASQAGAVLRYSLAPASDHEPAAFLRATRALVTEGETELAAGLSAKPAARLPLRAHAEIRTTVRARSTEIRPAVFLTTQIAPIRLPGKTKATLYAQGGYVGGDFATPFADGQARVDRSVAHFDLGKASAGEVRIGAGAWGGAQKGAARLDVGPSATITLESAPVPASLSLDYRVRVAGDAEPGSGLAVTLATSF